MLRSLKTTDGSIVAENAMGIKITGVPNPEKDNRSLLGFGIYCAIRLQREVERSRCFVTNQYSVTCAPKLDKYAVEYNAKKRSGVKTGTEKLAVEA